MMKKVILGLMLSVSAQSVLASTILDSQRQLQSQNPKLLIRCQSEKPNGMIDIVAVGDALYLAKEKGQGPTDEEWLWYHSELTFLAPISIKNVISQGSVKDVEFVAASVHGQLRLNLAEPMPQYDNDFTRVPLIVKDSKNIVASYDAFSPAIQCAWYRKNSKVGDVLGRLLGN